MLKKIIIAFLVLFFSLNSFAKYTQTCTVKYMKSDGWSKNYEVEVTFLTGSELNTATKSLNYSTFSTYAIIFWGQNQASVIKLTSYTGCGYETDKSCITNTYSDLKGNDQKDIEWKICVTDYCY